ncbi:NAD(P)H-binding protein [Aquisphaera insulae]|uniref:NAD(P)H-binding protein n=1 Tax=Aquisphaera insulae TaxID=2712864 RepID=UPI0013EA0660|nr:NAD(P)H-binding protein [Aquisphaera insulae]
MPDGEHTELPRILVTGGTGYVGGRLISRLEADATRLRALARKPEQLRDKVGPSTEVVFGDVADRASLDRALAGIETAYYLIHMMSNAQDFAKEDRAAAEAFGAAARGAGVRRIIYLGGLGDDDDPGLSPHLRSRHEVGQVLRDSGVETIEFRASIVIGAGSLSFDLVKSLTDRLPVMLCPLWLSTACQPIAIDDLLAYLLAAKDLPPGDSRIIEIGGADVSAYRDLIREYARQKGLRRVLIKVPVLTPYLSGLWLTLVTPTRSEVGRHLIEGLKNPTVVRSRVALDTFPKIRPIGVAEAIRRAIQGAASTLSATDATTGPS